MTDIAAAAKFADGIQELLNSRNEFKDRLYEAKRALDVAKAEYKALEKEISFYKNIELQYGKRKKTDAPIPLTPVDEKWCIDHKVTVNFRSSMEGRKQVQVRVRGRVFEKPTLYAAMKEARSKVK